MAIRDFAAAVRVKLSRVNERPAPPGSAIHECGTARMGRDPATSVVDQQLRVRGIDALAVADASVFPSIISGNTNAPSIMIGEKCARLVLEAAA